MELVAPADFMDRAFTQLDRAMCLVTDGDNAGATAYARDTVLSLSAPQRLGIISRRASQIVAAVPEHEQTLPPVGELRDLLMVSTERKGT